MDERHAGPKRILVGRKFLVALLWLFFAIAVWFGFSGAAHAASFTVTTYSDTVDVDPGNGACLDITGECSLRAALMETNMLSGVDEIVIPVGTYTLTTGQQLEIRDHVKLTGNPNDPGSTIIQASTSAVSATHRVLEINPDLNAVGYNVTIDGLTIRNGKAPIVSGYGGGGIGGDVGVSTTTISHSVISGNLAPGNGYGGGIYLSGAAAGKVRMTHVTLSGNKAGEASLTGYKSRGGGVYFEGDMGLELTNVDVQSNTSYGLGGGMAIVSETASLRNVSITDSSFTGNTAISKTAGPDTEGRAGGLYLGAPAVITGTQFANNTAGGDGGGLVLDFFAGSVSLNDVTITSNTGKRGGGMYINANKAPVLANSTISGNTVNDIDVNPEGTDMEVTIAPAAAPGGIFSQGKTGAHYSVTVQNTGYVKSNGEVRVTVTLPEKLTASNITGNGWTCALGTLTCTRSDALSGNSSYPVIDVTIDVAADAPRTVTSSAKVSGGDELDVNNDTGSHVTTILSRDSSLSNLSTSKGALEPLFSSDTLAYTVNVGYVVDKLAITPAVHESHATVKVKGASVTSGLPSGLLDLTVGDNAIPVLVTAEDGITTTTYTITVKRAPKSTNANLSDLTVSGGVTLNEAFSANTLSYTANVEHEIESLTVTPTVEYPQATVTVNGNQASDPVNLNVGDNTISVVVTAEDGTTKKTYSITVTREKSSNADLSALTISTGTLTPGFTTGDFSYTASVGNAITSIDVTPTVADNTATVTVNNDTVATGSAKNVALNVGANTVTVVVKAQDGTTTKTYTITVTRAKSSNADLSALSISAGMLAPQFTAGNGSYMASVGNEVTSIGVTPTVADNTARLTVNGDAVTSGSAKNVTLGVGTNTVTVVVTAEDGTTKTYTIAVTRAKSSNADLSALTISAGTLDPVFASGTESYTASVGNAVTSIDVTPTVTDSTATVTVNGDAIISGSAKNVTLNVGDNTVTVVVTAEDGTTTKTYTITVTRAKSSNADLSALTLSAGTLNPVFASGTESYTASVGNEVTSIDVTPTVADSTATVTVNGDAVASGSAKNVTLNVGDNTVTVVVTAQDGTTTKTYTITVTRAKSSNANLSALTLSEGTLDPVFASGTESYTASVGNEVTSIDVTPTVADATATVTVNSDAVTSGSAKNVTLSVGDNTVTVVVTAEDGTTKTYTITVTRAKSSISDLSALALSAGTLDPVFASGTESYTASVGNAVTSIDVTPTVADSTATVTVNNDTINSGSPKNVTLNAGDNTVTVVVTAEDGTTKTYTITVTRAKSSNADLSALTLSAGMLTPGFTAGNGSYTASVGNAITSIDVTPTVADLTATVKVNNDTVTSGSAKNVALDAGTNTVTVVVTAQDGTTTKTYTITVTRAKSSNANLSALTLSAGTLAPVFASGTESYTASVGNAVTSIDVTPTIADSTATVRVNNDTITSGNAKNVTLNVGTNTVTVVVMAQDGTTTKTYTITVTRAKSSNANLSALTLSAGTLDPSFASGTESYTASVGNAVTSIDVTPTMADSTAKVKVNGDSVASGSAKNVTLGVGMNTVTVVVTAEDGTTTKTYTITVTRAKSSNADLSALTLSAGTLTPGFTAGDVSYTASVGNAVTNIDVTPTVSDSTATVAVNDDSVASGSAKNVTLNAGDNTVMVVVTAEDGTTKTYTITVTRAKSSNADLSALTLSAGTLTPGFTAGDVSYTASVGNAVTNIDVTPTVSDSTATVAVNDDSVASGSAKNVTLNAGDNTVTVVVTAEDGTTKTYTITVTRAKSSNADLIALMLSAGTLTPGFTAGNENYTAIVGFDVTSVNVTPIAANTAAVIEVNEKQVVSGHAENVTLDVGANAIKVKMTSEDGTTSKTYNLIVTRLSNNTSLNELILTLGEQSIAVTGDNYSTSVTNAVYSATVTASVYDAKSSLQINGVTVASGSSSDIQLAEGPNTIVVKVTAQDLSVKEYTITVTRFGNAELSGLTVSGVTLTPPFNLSTLTYTGNVAYEVSAATVTASVYDPNAKISINGIEVSTDHASLPINLAVGDNDIKILVTPTLGDPQLYKITITRAPSNITSLLGLSINDGNVKVDKATDEKSYSATVSNSVSGITVKPQPTDPDAIVRVNGAALSPDGSSATIALNTGINEISISVTAPDGSVQTYKLFVTRLEAAAPPVIVTPDPPTVTVPDKVTIGGGDGTKNISIEVVREVTPDGRVIDKVTVTPELIKDLFEGVPGGVQNIIRLVIPKLPEGSSEFSFMFPTSAMEAMSEYGSILRIETDDIQINIPKETMATNVEWGEGMYFRFIPVPTEAVKQETVNRVLTSQVVTEAARGGKAVLLGTPMTIESNIINKETKMTFSLKGAAIPANPLERAAFLASLGVYIEHSDGEKVLKKGQIEYDAQGNPAGIEVVVTKFSTFSVIEVQKKQVGTDTYKSWIDGYPDGTFKPQRLITRAEVASILARVLSDPGRSNGSPSFSDVSESHWAASAIQKAQAAGWISGYPDGSFKPDAPITRAELAVIFARLNKLEAAAGSAFFTDTQDHWAAGFIQAAKAAGLLAGYEDGSFRPDRQLTRAEAVKAFNTLLKRPAPELGEDVWTDVTKQDWFWADVQSASASFNMIRYEDGSSFSSIIPE